MFESVTQTGSGRNARRKGLFLLGSTVVQIAAVGCVVVVAAALKESRANEPVVPVRFVRSPATPAPVATLPPRPPSALPPRRPRTVSRPLPVAALVQPRETPLENPEPATEEEVLDEAADDRESIVGGAATAGPATVAVPPPPAPAQRPATDEPAYAGAGFTRPRQADKGCVQSALRIPRGLEGLASTVTAKFAIGRDGAPSRFHLLVPGTDARIAEAIWQAVQSCRWLPGTHPDGTPTKLWVLMPFRFQPN